MDQVHVIRHKVLVERQSVRSVARQMRVSRNTFRQRYNEIRPHWALVPSSGADPITPVDVYRDAKVVQLPAWQGWARAAKEKLEKLRLGQELREAAIPA